MKKLFVLLFVAAAFAACGDASDLASAVENGADAAKDAAAAGTEAVTDAAAAGTEAVTDAAAAGTEEVADAAADMDAAPEAE